MANLSLNFSLTEFPNKTADLQGTSLSPPNTAERVGKTVVISLVLVLSLLGNTLVICAVFQRQRMRSITNYLIVNMSISDLLYTLVAMPPEYIQIFGLYDWALSGVAVATLFCKVLNFFQYMFLTGSLLTLAALAMDRYFAVMSPLKRVITNAMFAGILSIIWFTAVAVSSPLLYSLRVVNAESGSLSCNEIWVTGDAEGSLYASKAYTITLFVVIYCVPLFTMFILYSRISWFLWLRRVPGTQLEANQRKTEQSKKKVIKMLIAVVLVFVTCWLPLQVVTFVVFYSTNDVYWVSPEVYFLCEFLMRANACLNPVIYAIFSENYRQAFKFVVMKCLCPSKIARVPSHTVRSTMVSHTHYTSIGHNSPALEMKRFSVGKDM